MHGLLYLEFAQRTVGIDDETNHHFTLYLIAKSRRRVFQIVGEPLHELHHTARILRQFLHYAQCLRVVIIDIDRRLLLSQFLVRLRRLEFYLVYNLWWRFRGFVHLV